MFLDRLSTEDRDDLLAAGARRRFPAGSIIFYEGDVAHEALIVLEGLVKISVGASDGRQVILDVVDAGALVGEVASLDGGLRSATAEAMGPVEVLIVAIDRFTDYLVAHPTVLHDLAVVVAGRLRAGDRRQLEFGTGDSLARLCARLVDLSDRYGVVGDDGAISIESPLSQADLASWSGLSREAVVKSMRALRQLGWIDNRGSSITILEPDHVRERAKT